MTKTPDETKKGLEYLSIKDIVKKLDMWKEGIAYDYAEDAAADALALIQQLEKDKDDLLEERELNDFLRDKVKQLEAQAPRWISVEKRLPEGEVLAANFAPGTYGYKKYIIGYVSPPRVTEPGGCYAENDHEMLHDVTHWMPLPKPPKEAT